MQRYLEALPLLNVQQIIDYRVIWYSLNQSQIEMALLQCDEGSSVLGTFYNKISHPKLSHSFQQLPSRSNNLMNQTLTNFTIKEKGIGLKEKEIFEQKNMKLIRNCLQRYKRNEFSVAEYFSEDKKETVEIRAKTRQIRLERKYNVPISIKISAIQEAVDIQEQKNRLKLSRSEHRYSHQPLLKTANRIIRNSNPTKSSSPPLSNKNLPGKYSKLLSSFIVKKPLKRSKATFFQNELISFYHNQ